MDSIFPLAGPPADCVILGCLITTLRLDRLRNSIENSSLFADENHSPHKSQKLTLGGDWMNAAGEQRQHSVGEIQYNLSKEKLVICLKSPELQSLHSAGTIKLQAFVFFLSKSRDILTTNNRAIHADIQGAGQCKRSGRKDSTYRSHRSKIARSAHTAAVNVWHESDRC